MPYGNDVTVYVEDVAGDLGGPPTATSGPWWVSPDVLIPAHPGEASQGPNTVQIRVHANDEPVLEEKIHTEVYVGNPSLVMSPSANTKRIDPGNLVFRTNAVPGTEPVANVPGATLTFTWTPSSTAGDIDGPGHHCLILRAFPENVTPPGDPFTVPTEQHEAQHNIEILSTTQMMISGGGGAGTPHDPRRRDKDTELWWELLTTMAAKRRGRHFVVCAFDPKPNSVILKHLGRHKSTTKISHKPPNKVVLEGKQVEQIDPGELAHNGPFVEGSGYGHGLYDTSRLAATAAVDLDTKRPTQLRFGFDHSNLAQHGAVVLHVVQFTEAGVPEGGMTIVALAPV
jgi:hypothetical protein